MNRLCWCLFFPSVPRYLVLCSQTTCEPLTPRSGPIRHVRIAGRRSGPNTIQGMPTRRTLTEKTDSRVRPGEHHWNPGVTLRPGRCLLPGGGGFGPGPLTSPLLCRLAPGDTWSCVSSPSDSAVLARAGILPRAEQPICERRTARA